MTPAISLDVVLLKIQLAAALAALEPVAALAQAASPDQPDDQPITATLTLRDARRAARCTTWSQP